MDEVKDLIMANDVVKPLNPLVAIIKEEKFEKTSFDMNVSQRSREEDSSRIVVHTQIDCST